MSLIKKYNVPGPRYTSYPTVPYWNKEGIALADWQETLIRSFEESNDNGISIYIHLPFCENLCTFCGCHKKITKRHGVEDPYIKSVLKEWQLYVDLLPSVPNIKEIHLGGGTPTFFSPDNLKWLINGILEKADLSAGHEFSFVIISLLSTLFESSSFVHDEKTNNIERIAIIFDNMANIYRDLGNLSKALEYQENALKIFKLISQC